MAECACGQLRLPVENPVDDTRGSRARDSMPFKEINLFEVSDLVGALVAANDLLTARIDALELLINEVLELFAAPLTQAERVERVQAITKEVLPRAQAQA